MEKIYRVKLNSKGMPNFATAEEIPQGEWINHFDDLFPVDSTIECSICHEHQPMGIDENFCPNCGAKMDGERKEKSDE